MFFNFILILIGFIMLIKGADLLVDGASEIAKKLNIPEIVIGLTIVAIGTSMPELIVSATSAIEGYSDLAIGNVIGSNIANLFLILGICSIIKPLKFKKETILFEIPFTIFSTVLLFVLCINGIKENKNIILKSEGTILLISCFLFIIYNLIIAKKADTFKKAKIMIEIDTRMKEKTILKAILQIIVGIIGLKLGGDIVVTNSVKIATILGVTEKLISLTIIAFSTSLPELITSITATIKGDTDMAIGNVLGSQIFNIVLIIGISAILNPIIYSTSYNSNLILLTGGSILLGTFPMMGRKKQMTRSNGIIFIVIYIIYIVSLIY